METGNTANSRRGARPTPRPASNLVLLFASLAVALLMAEALLRVFAPQNFDIHPRGMYMADEAVGYVLSPDFEGTLVRSEYRHVVTTGPAGLRGPALRPRQPHTFRIVCLGDSFTWGFGVADDEAYPAVLRRQLASRFSDVDIQVVNAGVPGYGTVDELRFLRSRLPMLDPDLLVLTFFAENDFVENRSPARGRVSVEDGWLRSPVPPRDQPWQTLDWLKNRSHAIRLLSEGAGYLATRSGVLTAETTAPQVSPEDAEHGSELLQQIAAIVRSHGAESIFVFASSQAPVIAEAASEVAGSAVVASAAQEAGAGYLDLPTSFRRRSDRNELYYRRDGHWTATGHAAAAKTLKAYIEEHYAKQIESRATVASASESD